MSVRLRCFLGTTVSASGGPLRVALFAHVVVTHFWDKDKDIILPVGLAGGVRVIYIYIYIYIWVCV